MFSQFTESSIRSLQEAGRQAKGCGHSQVSDVHLLLAFAESTGNGMAHEILKNSGVTGEVVRERISKLLPFGEVTSERIEFDHSLIHILGLALDKRKRIGQGHQVSTGHLMLASIDVASGFYQILSHCVSDVQTMSRMTIEIISSPRAFALENEDQDESISPDIMSRLSGEVFAVLMLAEREVRSRGHNFISAEHLLLGVALQGIAIKEIDVAMLRNELDEIAAIGSGLAPRKAAFSPIAIEVLNKSALLAASADRNVRSEDVLNALQSLEYGTVRRILKKLRI